MDYEQARNYRVGDLIKLDLSPFRFSKMLGCLSQMFLDNKLVDGGLYKIKGKEEYNINPKDPFVVFEIESNGNRVKLGSHLFSR